MFILASKRAATSSPVDDIEYKKRKSNAAPRKSIPAAKTGGQQQARARKSASAVLTSAKPNLNTSGVQSNGLAGKKKAATPKSSAAARRDSGTLSPGLVRCTVIFIRAVCDWMFLILVIFCRAVSEV